MREWKKEVERRLAGLRLTPAREAEIVEELAQHLADRYQELEADGVGEAEAQRLAVSYTHLDVYKRQGPWRT